MKLARILPFLTVVTMILGTAGAYLGWRFIGPLDLSGSVQTLLWLALTGGVLIMPLAFMARFLDWSPEMRDRIAWVGFLAMGFFFLLLSLSLGRDLVFAGAALVGQVHALLASSAPAQLSTDWRNLSNLVILGLAIALGCYGIFAARHRLEIERVDLRIPGLHPGLAGLRIAQISDLHVGATIKRPYLERVVARVNELDADLIALTGDAVDGAVAELREHTAPLAELRARHGTFFCTGNHEYYAGVHAWIKEFRRLGLRVLLNEHELIEHGEGRLLVAGVTDYSGGAFDPLHRSDPLRALMGAPPAHFKLLLAHQPRSATAAARSGFDLQLSGHTHGGQIWPFHHLVKLQQPFRAGLHLVDSLRVYVNRGTGYWGPPLRLGARPEITLLTLRAD